MTMTFLKSINVDVRIVDDRLGTAEFPFPDYATGGSAGLDLRAMIESPLDIEPGDVELIPTGMAIHIRASGWAGMILPRSGLGHKHGIVLGNLVGLIDSDYQGEILISCWNRGKEGFRLNVGDRLAQLLLVPVGHAIFKFKKEFAASSRGHGGFGHSGQN